MINEKSNPISSPSPSQGEGSNLRLCTNKLKALKYTLRKLGFPLLTNFRMCESPSECERQSIGRLYGFSDIFGKEKQI